MLDEPLTGLDPVGRHGVIELIRELGARGRAVLVSSHILHEVEAMTEEVILVARGRIVAEGAIRRIRALIDRHPHSVEIRAGDPAALAVRLLEERAVVEVDLEEAKEGRLVVRTRDPDRFYDLLGEIGAEGAIPIEGFHSPDNDLAAVFRYLVE